MAGLGPGPRQAVRPVNRGSRPGSPRVDLTRLPNRPPFWFLTPENAALFSSDPSGFGYTRPYDPTTNSGVVRIVDPPAPPPTPEAVKLALKQDELLQRDQTMSGEPPAVKLWPNFLRVTRPQPARVISTFPRDRIVVKAFTKAMDLPSKSGIRSAAGLSDSPHPDSHTEHETYQSHGGAMARVVKATGQVFLGSVGDGSGYLTGENMFIRPLAASWLGGRLGVLCQEFSMAKAKTFRLVYRTLSSDFENGAVILTYMPDPSIMFLDTGVGYIDRISNYAAYLEIALKLNGQLDIHPGGGLEQDFTNTDNLALSNMKGFVAVVASCPFGSGATDPDVYGHVYLEYDVEFSKETLDTDVTTTYSGTMEWGMLVSTPVVANTVAPLAAAAVGATSQGNFVMTTSAPAGEYIIAMACRNYAFTAGSFTVANQANPVPFNPARGQVLFARTAIAASSTFSWTANTRLILFTSWADAQGGYEDYEVDGVGALESDALQFATVAATVSFTSSWNVLLFPLDRN